jgi:hypothetical protein
MTGDAEVLDRLAEEFPGPWRVWRRGDGVLCAWLVGTKPPLLLRAGTVDELREAVNQVPG